MNVDGGAPRLSVSLVAEIDASSHHLLTKGQATPAIAAWLEDDFACIADDTVPAAVWGPVPAHSAPGGGADRAIIFDDFGHVTMRQGRVTLSWDRRTGRPLTLRDCTDDPEQRDDRVQEPRYRETLVAASATVGN